MGRWPYTSSISKGFKRFLAALKEARSDPQHFRYIPIPLRQAGVFVNEDTALRFSAVFRAVSFVSQAISILPWDVLLEGPQKTTKLTNHTLRRLLGIRPNREMSAIAFRETLVAWALSWGNGYAEIERSTAGIPVGLWPISPDRVEVKRDPDTGEIVYHVSNYLGGTRPLNPEDIFHLHGLGFDGLVGYSVISLASRSVALGIAAEEYGADFFANGAVSTGALKHPSTLSPKARENIRNSFQEVMAGSGRRFNLPIFEEGMEWVDMMINPSDAQLLTTRQFQVTDIARWFGIPPHKLADLTRGTFSNIEHQTIEVVNDALMPWIHRLEQEANYKLIRPSEVGVRTRLNLLGLLRGDGKSRADYYQIMRNIGIYSTNEIRRLEDMDPVGPEGDELLVQLSFTTLKRVSSGDVKPAPQPNDPKILQHSFGMLFRSAYERILRREISQFERDGAVKKDFSAWFDQYFARERAKVEQDVEPLAMSFLASIASQVELNGNLSESLKTFCEWHIEASRQAFLSILAQEKTDFCSPERVNEGARFLAECLGGLCLGEKRIPAPDDGGNGHAKLPAGEPPWKILSGIHDLGNRLGELEKLRGTVKEAREIAAESVEGIARASEKVEKRLVDLVATLSTQAEAIKDGNAMVDRRLSLIEQAGEKSASVVTGLLNAPPAEPQQPIQVHLPQIVANITVEGNKPGKKVVNFTRDADGILKQAEIGEEPDGA